MSDTLNHVNAASSDLTLKALKGCFANRILHDQKYRHWVLLRLFRECQTHQEQTYHMTRDLNHVGFSAPDAPALSAAAEKLVRGNELTVREESILKNKLLKYWRQFVFVSLLEAPVTVRKSHEAPAGLGGAERAA